MSESLVLSQREINRFNLLTPMLLGIRQTASFWRAHGIRDVYII